METNYIQQLQHILQTAYIVPQNELDSIIDNYRLTIQTIIDETGSEDAVTEQLGSPSALAEEIAAEFHFSTRSTTSSTQPKIDMTWFLGNKNLNWPLIIGCIILTLFLGFPLFIAIFSFLASFILIFGGFLISSVVLTPLVFTTSPWFIAALFVAGVSSLSLIILLTIAIIRGLVFIIKKLFALPTTKPKKRVSLVVIITLIIVSTISTTAVFTLPFTDANLRSKIPYNMFQFEGPFDNANKQVFTKDINANDIKNLDLSGSGIHIKTSESNDDQYHVQVKTTNNNIDNVVKIENQTLIITNSESTDCLFCLDFGSKVSTIELAIPKNAQFDTFSAKVSGGSLGLSSIHAKDTSLQIAGGEISIADLISNTASFKITGGSIDTKSATIQSTIDVKVTGGSATFKTLEADTANLNITGGSIDIDSHNIKTINKNVTAGTLNV